MGVKDLFIAPIFLILLYFSAYWIRPFVTNALTKKYFIPALSLKFIGAISLGLVYQFYYGGGDTFTFHTHGSRWIWQAMMDNPSIGIKMFLSEGGQTDSSIFEYSSKIWMFRDRASYFVIKIVAFFDLLTFHTYSATTLFFALFAFSGNWALFTCFQKLYPSQKRNLAIAILFIPSVIFWGSGILKDSITIGSLCWMTYLLFEVVLWRKSIFRNILLILFFGWIIYSIKIYILLCFLIATSLFLYKTYSGTMKNIVTRIIIAPFFIVLFLGGGFFIMQKISEDDSRYAIGKIGQTAMITAYDIRYGWGARHGDNSGYTLGDLDGSIASLINLAPRGIIVTFFRPWFWEVKNPLMLLAAIESFVLLIMSIYILFRAKWVTLWKKINHPIILYCFSFSIIFAIAVGVSTFNFGSLLRYKIPAIPFYLIFLFLLNQTNTVQSNFSHPLKKKQKYSVRHESS